MNLIIDGKKAYGKWNPFLEELGVKSTDKKMWMSELAETQYLLESNAYANMANTRGMGAIRSAQPGAQPGLGAPVGGAYNGIDQYTGSGDVAANMIPTSMKIAAQTIGLELVTVKTTTSPVFDLVYVDFQYSDGKMDAPGNSPQTFIIDFGVNSAAFSAAITATAAAIGASLTVSGISKPIYVNITGATGSSSAPVSLTASQSIGSTALPTSKQGIMEFIGFSRIYKKPMFRTFRQTNAYNQAPSFDQTKNTFASSDAVTDVIGGANSMVVANSASTTTTVAFSTGTTVALISALEDHLEGFTSNWKKNTSMLRNESEDSYPFMIEPNVFTKKIQVGDIQVGATLKRTHIEDIKASTGYDILQKTEGILINELSQKISKEIVSTVFSLGDLNRLNAPTVTVITGSGTNTYSKFDFNVDDYLDQRAYVGGPVVTPGGEMYLSLQRKLASKIKNASSFIQVDGRIGSADYLVTNYNLASVLGDAAGYTINPVGGATSMNKAKQLYPVGTIDGITVYVDPNMPGDDNRIVLGRKNAVDEPGLLFVPYLMAQSISLITEGTFSNKMILRSRYAVAQVGFYPEKQFITIKVTDTKGILI